MAFEISWELLDWWIVGSQYLILKESTAGMFLDDSPYLGKNASHFR